MTDHQQAAIEAANRELRDYSAVCYCPGSPEYVDSLDKIDEGDAAERAIAAAEPHLRKKWAEKVRAMSELDIDAIKARLDKAHTEWGPWKAEEDSWDGYSVVIDDSGPGVSIIAEQIGQGEDKGRGDAEFIAHAPEDIAALITEVETLRGQVYELAALWEAATDAVNIDTDASLGEWQTAFDGLVAKYHESGYRAGSQDSLTENTALRALGGEQ